MSFLVNAMSQAAAGAGVVETDEYFNQTTLLLHGDGTNGAQNNTFLDSSTNNFTITRNGNTTQGSFSPFSADEGKWSNYFDGTTNNSLYFTSTSEFTFSGAFTIEFWVNPVLGALRTVFSNYESASAGLTCYIQSSGTVSFYYAGDSRIDGTIALNNNQWNHVAISGTSGSSWRIYINGVADTSSATSLTASTSTFGIGDFLWGAAGNRSPLKGYLSNFRCVNGTALYTSAFTPPTEPLTNIANTVLLTCQSNRFVDNSTTPYTLIAQYNPSVQPFSPFAPSAAYSTSVNGGSGYFDGSGDYLVAPSSSAFGYGTGDFTISFWLYKTSTATSYIIDQRPSSTFYMLYVNGALQVPSNNYGSAGSVKTNAWTHVVVSRVSGTTRIFTDGVQGTADADSNNYATSTLRLGEYNATGYPYLGYIADFHVQKGVGVTSVTVPTAPPTPTANTSLLLNFTNAGIFDSTAKNNLETVGNAQVDTSTKKYGTGSMEFDGTGDKLVTPPSQNAVFGTGDFTIECWLYVASNPAQYTCIASNWAGADPSWNLNFSNGSGNIRFNNNGSIFLTSSSAITTGQFVHIAVARSGTSLKMFFDGVEVASATNSTSFGNSSTGINIGMYYNNTYPLNGYIDDLRITKGVARYTSNFTVPDKAFPDQ